MEWSRRMALRVSAAGAAAAAKNPFSGRTELKTVREVAACLDLIESKAVGVKIARESGLALAVNHLRRIESLPKSTLRLRAKALARKWVNEQERLDVPDAAAMAGMNEHEPPSSKRARTEGVPPSAASDRDQKPDATTAVRPVVATRSNGNSSAHAAGASAPETLGSMPGHRAGFHKKPISRIVRKGTRPGGTALSILCLDVVKACTVDCFRSCSPETIGQVVQNLFVMDAVAPALALLKPNELEETGMYSVHADGNGEQELWKKVQYLHRTSFL